MKTTRLVAVLVGLAAISLFATDATAMYNPSLGRWMQRDPGQGGMMPATPRVGGGPVAGGAFLPRDQIGMPSPRAPELSRSVGSPAFPSLPPHAQYADGCNLYQYVRSMPTRLLDPHGTESIQINSITMKRKHIKWSVVFGKEEGDGYGHWWTEIDGTESYGWWPKAPVPGLLETIFSVEGEMNARYFGGTATTDPHHGDAAEEEFHPWRAEVSATVTKLKYGKAKDTKCPCASEEQIKDCVQAFVKDYAATHTRWSYPLGNNCHSFQRDLMNACCLKKRRGEGFGAWLRNE